MNNRGHHWKPDIMLVLVFLVVLALSATLTLQLHLLSGEAGSARPVAGLFR